MEQVRAQCCPGGGRFSGEGPFGFLLLLAEKEVLLSDSVPLQPSQQQGWLASLPQLILTFCNSVYLYSPAALSSEFSCVESLGFIAPLALLKQWRGVM